VIGDHDYKRDILKLNNVNSAAPCSHCPADRKGVPWFDFGWAAEWTSRCYDASAAMVCELLQMSAGLSILSVQPDWMHDKYLGTDKVCMSYVCSVCLILSLSACLMFGVH
jgi:hypothetical protein